MKHGMRFVASSFILLWVLSCATNPVTGKREFVLLSEQDEIRMGQETDPQIVEMYGVYDDEDLAEYIENLGQQMAKVSHRPQLNYEFKIMDSPVVNAFAVPGGYVYFTRGILAYLNNEAELAGVMGHEIGHITARHSAKQYSKAQLVQVGLGLGSVLSEVFSQYAGMVSQGIGLLFLKFSRNDEREADDLGVEYSSRVGYDAREMANFFNTLNRMGSGKGSLPDFLSTHANPENRVGAVRSVGEGVSDKRG
jgi:predicted Zn-dependent protease